MGLLAILDLTYVLIILGALGFGWVFISWKVTENKLQTVSSELERTTQQFHEAERRLLAATDSIRMLNEILEKYAFVKKPCCEVDTLSIPRYLAKIEVLGANQFRLQGERNILNCKEVIQSFSASFHKASQNQCALGLQIRGIQGVTYDDFIVAQNCLKSKFNYLRLIN